MNNEVKTNIVLLNSNNYYYKGEINNLEVWNNGFTRFCDYYYIDLFTQDGNFYKKELVQKYYEKKEDLNISKYNISKYSPLQYEIIQIDYNFYLIQIVERLSVIEGRNLLCNMLTKYGIKGINSGRILYIEKYCAFQKKNYYEVFLPIEICSYKIDRRNTKSFANFEYKNYLENKNKAIKNYPDYKDEIENIFDENIKIICGFYEINEKELKKENFDRLKHSIKILNKKITNNIKF